MEPRTPKYVHMSQLGPITTADNRIPPHLKTMPRYHHSNSSYRLPRYVNNDFQDQADRQDQLATLEKRYATESKLMLSAWQDLGSRTSRDHLIHALSNSTKRSGTKSMPQGWLGKQRRYQEDAGYVSFPPFHESS